MKKIYLFELKAYYIEEENWEDYLVSIGMTEDEYKAYKGGIEWDISGLPDNAPSPYKRGSLSAFPYPRPADWQSVEQHHGGVQLFF